MKSKKRNHVKLLKNKKQKRSIRKKTKRTTSKRRNRLRGLRGGGRCLKGDSVTRRMNPITCNGYGFPALENEYCARECAGHNVVVTDRGEAKCGRYGGGYYCMKPDY